MMLNNTKKQYVYAMILLSLSGAMASTAQAETVTTLQASKKTIEKVGTAEETTLLVNGEANVSSDAKGIVAADQGGTVTISDYHSVEITPTKGYGIHVGGSGTNLVDIKDVQQVNLATSSNMGIKNEGGTVSILAGDVSLSSNKYAISTGNTANRDGATNTTTVQATGTVTLKGGIQVAGSQDSAEHTSTVSVSGKNISLTNGKNAGAVDISGYQNGGANTVTVKATDDLTITGGINSGTDGAQVNASFSGKNVTLQAETGPALSLQNGGEDNNVNISGETISIKGTQAIANNKGNVTITQQGQQGAIHIDGSIITGSQGTTNLSAEGDTTASTGKFTTTTGGTVNFQKGTWHVNSWSGTDGNVAVKQDATLQLNTSISVDKVTLEKGSTTIIDSAKMTDGKGITITDAKNSTVDGNFVVNNFNVGDKLQLVYTNSQDKDQVEAGTLLNQQAAQNVVSNHIMQKFEADADGNLKIGVADATQVLPNTILKEVVTAATGANDTRFTPFLQDTNAETATTRLNGAANIAALGGTTHSTYTTTGIFTDAVADHAATGAHGIWAKAFHNKETVDALDGISYTGQYNGTVIGADLKRHGDTTIGVAMTYTDGNVRGTTDGIYTKNDVSFWGGAVYGRKKAGDYTVVGDISYLRGSHDLAQQNGDVQVTAKPDTTAWSVGTKVFKEFAVSHTATLTPYAGVRYIRLATDEYTSSLGIDYDTAAQNLFVLPVGITYTAQSQQGQWLVKPYVGAGYIWNVGNRNADVHASFGAGVDGWNVTTTDANSVLLQAGFTAETETTVFGVDYRWQQGNTTKHQAWNVNLGYKF